IGASNVVEQLVEVVRERVLRMRTLVELDQRVADHRHPAARRVGGAPSSHSRSSQVTVTCPFRTLGEGRLTLRCGDLESSGCLGRWARGGHGEGIAGAWAAGSRGGRTAPSATTTSSRCGIWPGHTSPYMSVAWTLAAVTSTTTCSVATGTNERRSRSRSCPRAGRLRRTRTPVGAPQPIGDANRLGLGPKLSVGIDDVLLRRPLVELAVA